MDGHMPERPPWPYRWEAQLASALLSLALSGLSRRPPAPQQLDAALATPELRRWWEAGRASRSRPAWHSQFATERSILRAATGFVLAWRSYRLEHRH